MTFLTFCQRINFMYGPRSQILKCILPGRVLLKFIHSEKATSNNKKNNPLWIWKNLISTTIWKWVGCLCLLSDALCDHFGTKLIENYGVIIVCQIQSWWFFENFVAFSEYRPNPRLMQIRLVQCLEKYICSILIYSNSIHLVNRICDESIFH